MSRQYNSKLKSKAQSKIIKIKTQGYKLVETNMNNIRTRGILEPQRNMRKRGTKKELIK